MKNKVCIIIPYFGKFPNVMEAFLLSCKENSNFQWIIFTDEKLDNVPQNVRVIYCTLSDIKNQIEQKIKFSVALNAPYKLCDYRPAFGLIFEEYMKEYDFWGYGDIDLVYGDLSQFITDELLEKYDKIYPCGHLSLVRNQPDINRAFMLQNKRTLDYREVFTHDRSYIFDEYKGINEKLLFLGKKIYGQIDFADMDVVYQRFRTADKKTVGVVFPEFLYKKYLPKNYRNQTFYYENGKTYRVYIDENENVRHQEVVYIHYRHKISCEMAISENSNFYITNEGIKEKNNEISISDIINMNPYPGRSKEIKEYSKFYQEQMVYRLGKNKKFRNFIRFLKGKKKIR